MSGAELSALLENLVKDLDSLDKNVETTERNVYIIAGVLGGVNLILICAIIGLFILVKGVRTKLADAEVEKKVEEEMKNQKFAAYTGEEMHRKLMAVSNPAVPIGQSESEYAFNAPYQDNRLDAGQFGKYFGKGLSRFPRQN